MKTFLVHKELVAGLCLTSCFLSLIEVSTAYAWDIPIELEMVMDPGKSGAQRKILFNADSGKIRGVIDAELSRYGSSRQPVGSALKNEASVPLITAVHKKTMVNSNSSFIEIPFSKIVGETDSTVAISGTQQPVKDNGGGPELDVSVGYRKDELSWSIASVYGVPNIISELTWNDLEAIELSSSLRWTAENGLHLRAGFSYGWVYSGDVQDSDYWGNNRTMEFSRSYSKGDDSKLYDGHLGIGYRFDVPLGSSVSSLSLIPIVGYAWHVQDLKMTNGVQAVSDYHRLSELRIGSSPPPVGYQMPDLDSSYKTDWQGVWLGLDLDWTVNEKHSFAASFEYHIMDYEAEANWNLRHDLAHPVSFEHEADGDGVVFSLDYKYRSSQEYSFSIGVNYMDFETDSGTARFHSAGGATTSTKLNEVEWESYAVHADFEYRF